MIEPEVLFETRWLGLYRIGHWDFAKRPNADAAVGILAVTPDAEIVLIEQFRIPLQQKVIEIPAGLVGDEEEFHGESLAETAARELMEETGYRAEKIVPLLASPTSPGMTPEITHLFHATGLVKEGDGGGTGHEDIRVHLVPLQDLRPWLEARQAEGYQIDFKIHACLWAAGIS